MGAVALAAPTVVDVVAVLLVEAAVPSFLRFQRSLKVQARLRLRVSVSHDMSRIRMPSKEVMSRRAATSFSDFWITSATQRRKCNKRVLFNSNGQVERPRMNKAARIQGEMNEHASKRVLMKPPPSALPLPRVYSTSVLASARMFPHNKSSFSHHIAYIAQDDEKL